MTVRNREQTRKRLTGRVAVVTGGARGVGEGVGRALVEEGARVILGDLDDRLAQELATELSPDGSAATGVFLDVTDQDSISRALQTAVDTFGGLDALVNNAGQCKLQYSLDDTADSWRRHFDVNTTATFACSVAAARRMIDRGVEGAIVNVASEEGKVGHAFQLAYNASKAAVINFTRGLALELHPNGINVNAVCPGAVETRVLRSVAEYYASVADDPQLRKLLPEESLSAAAGGDVDAVLDTFGPVQLGRLIQPIEVGRVVAFLLSDEARIIRGQAINVDAGGTPY